MGFYKENVGVGFRSEQSRFSGKHLKGSGKTKQFSPGGFCFFFELNCVINEGLNTLWVRDNHMLGCSPVGNARCLGSCGRGFETRVTHRFNLFFSFIYN